MRTLYPEIEPYHTGILKVSDLHTLNYEEVGNPQGKPVVYLHGGPGGGINAIARRFYDPEFYRIILFDQRGSGKSTPSGELSTNTTWDLVSDMERLRNHLSIDRWLVFGGSWGSTLSLSYAIRHPEKVLGLILRGIFLCRTQEIQWFYQEGASNIYPEAWESFLAPIPLGERGDLVSAYYQRMTGTDEQIQLEAAKAWCIWETATGHLFQDTAGIQKLEKEPQTAIPFGRIECHYMFNKAFFPNDDFLLNETRKINAIPTRIVQGRYDMICPITSAWDLKKSMPAADLRIIPDAGHSALEPGITSELIAATDDFRSQF